jgi:hypothetical protein
LFGRVKSLRHHVVTDQTFDRCGHWHHFMMNLTVLGNLHKLLLRCSSRRVR